MVSEFGLFWIKLSDSRKRNEVNVDMINREAFDRDPDAGNLEDFLQAPGDSFGCSKYRLVIRVIHVKEIRGMRFWNDERMPFADGVDVQEREVKVILPDFVAGDFTGDDFAKETVGHREVFEWLSD